MLGKLIKYELKSTSRLFLPFYVAVLILSLLNRMLFVVLNNIDFLNVPRALMMVTYVFIIIATFVLTYIVMIQRFYKNLLGDEGYLSMTLPVKASSHIISKGITSAIWIVSTIIITLISIFLMISDYSFVSVLFSQWGKASSLFYEATGMNLNLVVFLGCILMIIALFESIMMIYTAMAFGQLANKHRVLVSFGAYIAIYAFLQVVMTIFISVAFQINLNELTTTSVFPSSFFLAILISAIGLGIIFIIGSFFTTKYLLGNKLNLE